MRNGPEVWAPALSLLVGVPAPPSGLLALLASPDWNARKAAADALKVGKRREGSGRVDAACTLGVESDQGRAGAHTHFGQAKHTHSSTLPPLSLPSVPILSFCLSLSLSVTHTNPLLLLQHCVQCILYLYGPFLDTAHKVVDAASPLSPGIAPLLGLASPAGSGNNVPRTVSAELLTRLYSGLDKQRYDKIKPVRRGLDFGCRSCAVSVSLRSRVSLHTSLDPGTPPLHPPTPAIPTHLPLECRFPCDPPRRTFLGARPGGGGSGGARPPAGVLRAQPAPRALARVVQGGVRHRAW